MRCVMLAATTIDGKIAHDSGHPSEWTSPEDKRFLYAFLEKVDVVVAGRNTYQTAPDFFSKYNCIVLTSLPEKKGGGKGLVYCDPQKEDLRTLLSPHETVAVLGGTQTYTYFLEHDLIDELCLTIEPLVFGRGLTLFESSHNAMQVFSLASLDRLNDRGSVLLRYVRA